MKKLLITTKLMGVLLASSALANPSTDGVSSQLTRMGYEVSSVVDNADGTTTITAVRNGVTRVLTLSADGSEIIADQENGRDVKQDHDMDDSDDGDDDHDDDMDDSDDDDGHDGSDDSDHDMDDSNDDDDSSMSSDGDDDISDDDDDDVHDDDDGSDDNDHDDDDD